MFLRAHVYTHRGSKESRRPLVLGGPPKGDPAEATDRASQVAERALGAQGYGCPPLSLSPGNSSAPTPMCFLCSREDPSINLLVAPLLLSALFKQPPGLLQVLSRRTFELQILDCKRSADPAGGPRPPPMRGNSLCGFLPADPPLCLQSTGQHPPRGSRMRPRTA